MKKITLLLSLLFLTLIYAPRSYAQTPGTMAFGSGNTLLVNAANPSVDQSLNTELNGFDVSAITTGSIVLAIGEDGNEGGSDAIGGSGDAVLGWFGSGASSITSGTISTDTGSEIGITSLNFAYKQAFGATTVNFTFTGKRDGSDVGTLVLNSPTHNSSINVDFTSPTTGSFENIDELVITPQTPISGGFVIDDVIITVAMSNTTPTITIDNLTLNYTEGNTATQIDPTGTVNDADGDADWNGGTLVAQITANAEAADEISISDTDGDGTAITTSGTNILANGTDIGDLSVSGGTVTNNTALTITFDSDATNAIVQEVLQSLRYRNTSTTPGTSNRTITITANDTNGGTANDTRTVSVSTVAPVAPVVTTPGSAITVNAATQTIAGTHPENGVTVHAYADADNNGTADNTVSLGSATVTGNAWSFSVNLTADAANNFVVSATDGVDTSSDVDVSTITEDSTSPADPVVTTPGSAITVNAASQIIAGTHTENGVTVHAYADANNDGTADNTTSLGSATVTGNTWSFSVNLNDDAANNFVVQAEDNAGNTSNNIDVPTITEDSTSPANPILTSPTGAITVNAATQTVTGLHPENGVTVHAYADANNDGVADNTTSLGNSTVALGLWSISVNLTADSANNFVVQAEDNAGNTSGDVNVPTITEDSTSPADPVVITPGSAITVDAATQTIAGTHTENGVTVHAYADANNDGTADNTTSLGSATVIGNNWSFSVNLTADSTNNFVVQAEDNAGNTSNDVDVPTITEDSTNPADPIVITPSSAITVNAATQTIAGTHTENGVTVHAYADANNDGTADNITSLGSATVTANAWSFSVNLTQDATNNFVVQAEDNAGNMSNNVDVPTITEDSTSPADPVVTTPGSAMTINSATQTITGTHTENGVTVHAYADANNDGTADNTTSLGSATVAGNNWSFSVNLTQDAINNFVVQAIDNAGNTSNDIDVPTITETSAITWTGTTNNSWNTASNWNINAVPVASSDVTIPNSITNYPTISSAVTVNSINIASGASLIANASVTGTTTYTRNLPTTNWYLVTAPVSGETQQDIIANHTFASGSGSNIGIGAFTNNGATPWVYATTATTGPLVSGAGVSMKLAAAGDVSITGVLNTSNVSFPIATGTRNNFNLIGNPFTSFVSSSNFATANTGLLSEETVWLWDGSQYVTYNAASPIQVAPAQGFFVEASGSGNVTFSTANQSHQSSDTFMRTTPMPSFELFVEDDTNKQSTRVFFVDGKTTGFDNGYDSKIFGGVTQNFAVFTQLIANDNGNKLAIQTLPNTDYETMVIPVGIIAEAGKQIIFSVVTQNLPSGVEIYLEDRVNNTFFNLSEETHSVTLRNDNTGIGRFYIHTTSERLGTNDVTTLENISIYKSATKEITIAGLQTQATIKVFSLLGKEVANKEINSNGISAISLPSLSTGIYIVRLSSNLGNMTKKIVID